MASRSAREEFICLFGVADASYIDDFLAKHAHELAEKIRPMCPEPQCCEACAVAYHTRIDDADLIDPGVAKP